MNRRFGSMVRLLVVDEPSGQTTLVFYAARMTQLRKSFLIPSHLHASAPNRWTPASCGLFFDKPIVAPRDGSVRRLR